jgi:DNA (cytosine-5)-methyltransferase 1
MTKAKPADRKKPGSRLSKSKPANELKAKGGKPKSASQQRQRSLAKGAASASMAVLPSQAAHLSKEAVPGAFTFIDLFAGIGGMRRGFEAVGGTCVFTSEWDTYAQKTYRANFQDAPGSGHIFRDDITKVHETQVPDHDVLLAGFPCQPFSIAGVSKLNSLGRSHGFLNKTQGTLFFDVLRILIEKRPAAFLLENVKNLKSHNKGDTFKTIEDALKGLGYCISSHVIDAKGYVPQHRERIFIAGFRSNTGFDLPKLDFSDPASGPKLSEILHAPDEPEERPFTLLDKKKKSRVVVDPRYTLSDKLWQYLQGYAAKHKAAGNGFGYGLNKPGDTARTLSARYYKDGSEILIQQPGKNPRRLTPRECARLMGFDPTRKEDRLNAKPMQIPVSDTRAYKQFGNAVVVPVVEAIASHMKPHIMKSIAMKAIAETEAVEPPALLYKAG